MSPGRNRKGSRSGSSSGNRSDGEGGLYGKDYGKDYSQPFIPAYCMSQSYLGGSSLFSSGSSTSLSPYQSPARVTPSNLASVSSKTKSLSLLADRPTNAQVEYNGSSRKHTSTGQHGIDPKVSPMPYDRDQSLDRHVDQKQQRHQNMDSHYHTIGGYGRDRSCDREREYPHMGARSLEREHQLHSANMLRSRSSDHEYRVPPSLDMYSSSPPDSRHARDALILDLQSQVAELNKECAILQQELDSAKDKLGSTMNSIKTFWSPELKKERAVRKEENAKHTLLIEQLKMAEIENRQHLGTVVQLEQENRSLRELSLSSGSGTSGATGPHESDVLRKEKERHAREMKLLRKTIEEMELRIETQKQTLSTRDESIKKLMDMLQSKSRPIEDERQLSDEARHIRQLEQLLEQKDGEMGKLRHDVQLQSIQKELQSTKDEIVRLNEESASGRESIEMMKTQEKMLKEKLETTKIDLSRKEAENGALQTQIETLKKHWEDHERHISVLRDQIGTKEEQGAMLQADLAMLRDRLKEKDESLEKKSRQLSSLVSDKKKLEEELNDVKDQLEGKNRKLNSLQRKVENLEDIVKEKEAVISSTKAKLASLQADHNTSGSALSSLEELLVDKERQIDRLREQRERVDRQYEEEVDLMSKKLSDLKLKYEELQNELAEKQKQEVELKEELSRLKSERIAKESLISRLELDISDKADEISQLQSQLRKLDECVSQSQVDCDRKILELKKDLEDSQNELNVASVELENYTKLVKDLEKEKSAFELQRAELQKQLKELSLELTEMKLVEAGRSHHAEGSLKSPESIGDDATLLKSVIVDKESRIEELEEALRESIRITAQREVVMAEQQMKLEHTERVMESMQEEVSKVKKTAEENMENLARTRKQLEEKEDALKALQGDSKRQLSEVYEMKQEAILAAISEKDAHIALLEMAPNKKTENIEEVEKLTREKLRLQQVLKDLTQSRMKLIHNRGHLRSSSASNLLLSASNEQDDDGL